MISDASAWSGVHSLVAFARQLIRVEASSTPDRLETSRCSRRLRPQVPVARLDPFSRHPGDRRQAEREEELLILCDVPVPDEPVATEQKDRLRHDHENQPRAEEPGGFPLPGPMRLEGEEGQGQEAEEDDLRRQERPGVVGEADDRNAQGRDPRRREEVAEGLKEAQPRPERHHEGQEDEHTAQKSTTPSDANRSPLHSPQ